MNPRYWLLLVVVGLLLTDVTAGKRHRRKKNRKTSDANPLTLERDALDMMANDEEFEEENEVMTEEEELEEARRREDPCRKKHCGPGRECVVTEEGEADCACVKDCPYEEDHRRNVCTNRNETLNSDCEVYRQRCLCVDRLEGCTNKKNKHLHVEYYGKCREIGVCAEDEMEDFPRRMREWLYNVMRDMAERRDLSEFYLDMEREAEEDETKRWENAAVWRWCELDTHPHDKSVSRHELFPIRAPLLALEQCMAPFLDGCDADGDHSITLKEWASCLGIEKERITERCERIKDTHKSN